MIEYSWNNQFLTLYERCVEHYRKGNTNYNSYYTDEDLALLREVGYKPREFFDYVEDYCDGADLPPTTALLIAAVRRAYLHRIQGGKPSRNEVLNHQLPDKQETVAGIPWLPRIIAKARGKLRGELHPDIMFGCGGDRAFLTKFDIHPADFLEVVWDAAEDDQKILSFVHGRKASV